jgi:hypothetical protein
VFSLVLSVFCFSVVILWVFAITVMDPTNNKTAFGSAALAFAARDLVGIGVF